MSAEDEVASFIRSTFRSVWSLELMLHLLRNRERSWSREELVTALRGSDSTVAHSLDLLIASGLVAAEPDGRAQFSPASSDLDGLAERAAELYARSPDAVRRLIVMSANTGLNAFADSFRLRRD